MSINSYSQAIDFLKKNKHTWVVTGVAGFIGSNLMQKLLELDQKVIGLDNLSTGYLKNIEEVKSKFDKEFLKKNFVFHEIDIIDYNACLKIFQDAASHL